MDFNELELQTRCICTSTPNVSSIGQGHNQNISLLCKPSTPCLSTSCRHACKMPSTDVRCLKDRTEQTNDKPGPSTELNGDNESSETSIEFVASPDHTRNIEILTFLPKRGPSDNRNEILDISERDVHETFFGEEFFVFKGPYRFSIVLLIEFGGGKISKRISSLTINIARFYSDIIPTTEFTVFSIEFIIDCLTAKCMINQHPYRLVHGYKYRQGFVENFTKIFDDYVSEVCNTDELTESGSNDKTNNNHLPRSGQSYLNTAALDQINPVNRRSSDVHQSTESVIKRQRAFCRKPRVSPLRKGVLKTHAGPVVDNASPSKRKLSTAMVTTKSSGTNTISTELRRTPLKRNQERSSRRHVHRKDMATTTRSGHWNLTKKQESVEAIMKRNVSRTTHKAAQTKLSLRHGNKRKGLSNASRGASSRTTLELESVTSNRTLFGRQLNSSVNNIVQHSDSVDVATVQDFNMTLNFLKEPVIKYPSTDKDLVSALCKRCKHHVVHSKVDPVFSKRNCAGYCAYCALTGIKIDMEFCFRFVLNIAHDNQNYDLLVVGKDAQMLLACTEKEFLQNEELRERVVRRLAHAILKHTAIRGSVTCTTPLHSLTMFLSEPCVLGVL